MLILQNNAVFLYYLLGEEVMFLVTLVCLLTLFPHKWRKTCEAHELRSVKIKEVSIPDHALINNVTCTIVCTYISYTGCISLLLSRLLSCPANAI